MPLLESDLLTKLRASWGYIGPIHPATILQTPVNNFHTTSFLASVLGMRQANVMKRYPSIKYGRQVLSYCPDVPRETDNEEMIGNMIPTTYLRDMMGIEYHVRYRIEDHYKSASTEWCYLKVSKARACMMLSLNVPFLRAVCMGENTGPFPFLQRPIGNFRNLRAVQRNLNR